MLTVTIIASVSPPTRGWTLGLNAAEAANFGFPAHAGMDPRSCPSEG